MTLPALKVPAAVREDRGTGRWPCAGPQITGEGSEELMMAFSRSGTALSSPGRNPPRSPPRLRRRSNRRRHLRARSGGSAACGGLAGCHFKHSIGRLLHERRRRSRDLEDPCARRERHYAVEIGGVPDYVIAEPVAAPFPRRIARRPDDDDWLASVYSRRRFPRQSDRRRPRRASELHHTLGRPCVCVDQQEGHHRAAASVVWRRRLRLERARAPAPGRSLQPRGRVVGLRPHGRDQRCPHGILARRSDPLRVERPEPASLRGRLRLPASSAPLRRAAVGGA